MDYYNFNTIYNNAKQTNPSFEIGWALINKGTAVPPDTDNNFAQISATSEKPERAVMFLDWIQASQDNYDLWYYGIKDKHYTLSDKGEIVYPEGSVSTALPYAPTPWWFRNYQMDRAISTDSEISKQAQAYFKDEKILDLPDTAAFTFDTKNVDLQITQINSVIKGKWNDLSNGVLKGDAEYQTYLKALNDAGMPDVIAEMQKQLDAWRAAHK
jgi:putative aldouronate transport system substrate-binding protein